MALDLAGMSVGPGDFLLLVLSGSLAAGVDQNGRFRGQAIPTGVRPRFTDKFADRGIILSPAVFGATLLGNGPR